MVVRVMQLFVILLSISLLGAVILSFSFNNNQIVTLDYTCRPFPKKGNCNNALNDHLLL